MLNTSAKFWLTEDQQLIKAAASPANKPYVRLVLEDGRTVDITLNLLAQLGAQARDIIIRKKLD